MAIILMFTVVNISFSTEDGCNYMLFQSKLL